MQKEKDKCFKCDGSNQAPVEELFGYIVCETCKSKMGLFRDETIQGHVESAAKARLEDPSHPTYQENVANRLVEIEKSYISWRIKLLHIQERIDEIEKD